MQLGGLATAESWGVLNSGIFWDSPSGGGLIPAESVVQWGCVTLGSSSDVVVS